MDWLQTTAVVGVFSTLVLGIIAIIYYFRSASLMTAIGATKWSEISDHYPQIKFLRISGWKM